MTARGRTRTACTLVGVIAALLTPGVAGADPASVAECEAVKNSRIPYELMIRFDDRSVVRDGKKVVLPPLTDFMRVLRGEGGQVVTLLRGRDSGDWIRSRKSYYRTLEAIPTSGAPTTVVQEGRPADDPVTRKEDFTEIYTMEQAGAPPRRRRMDARFVGEDTVEITPCRFKVHRYRTILHADPSPDGVPLSETMVDYAPELLVPVRQVATSPVITHSRTATDINTRLVLFPDSAPKSIEP